MSHYETKQHLGMHNFNTGLKGQLETDKQAD